MSFRGLYWSMILLLYAVCAIAAFNVVDHYFFHYH
jgi:hypothetical protein